MPGKTLGDLRPKTDEAQWGVNAFVVVSCGFSLLLCHIFAETDEEKRSYATILNTEASTSASLNV